MKNATALLFAIVLALALVACASKSWVCDSCGKSFKGTAYYGMATTETYCEDCARSYWMPLDYKNYQKR